MAEQSFDLAGVSVRIGMPILGMIPAQTAWSLLDTVMALKDRGIHCDPQAQYGCSIIEQARTFVATDFLASGCTHLFMIDADQTWKPEQFLAVLALATKLPIVAAPYPYKRDPEAWFFNPSTPCAVNEFGCLPVEGVGLGFCCVQRRVLESLSEIAPRLRFVGREQALPHLFRCDSSNGHFRGEDMAFFADCKQAGYQAWLYPHAVGHLGTKEYQGDFLAAIQSCKKERNERQQVQPDDPGRRHDPAARGASSGGDHHCPVESRRGRRAAARAS